MDSFIQLIEGGNMSLGSTVLLVWLIQGLKIAKRPASGASAKKQCCCYASRNGIPRLPKWYQCSPQDY